jgi:hypothetical protein
MEGSGQLRVDGAMLWSSRRALMRSLVLAIGPVVLADLLWVVVQFAYESIPERWLHQSYEKELFKLREFLQECDGCGFEWWNPGATSNVWSGGNFGLGLHAFCDACYRDRSKPLIISSISCDYYKWEMFCGVGEDDRCSEFDLRQGWHSRTELDETLCNHHFHRLDPHQERWSRVSVVDPVDPLPGPRLVYRADPNGVKPIFRWRRVSVEDLRAFDPEEPVYRHPDGEGPIFQVKRVTLNIPHELDEQVLAASQKWFLLERGVRAKRVQLASIKWLQGQRFMAYGSSTLVSHPAFANIAEWLPFDVDGDGDLEQFALLNCNASSPYYKQVATAYQDGQKRVGVDLAQMDVHEYQRQRRLAPNPEVLHPLVRCAKCHQTIKGPIWASNQTPGRDSYILCQTCWTKSTAIRKSDFKIVPTCFITIRRAQLHQPLNFTRSNNSIM